jgi:transposase-like protein
LLRTRPKTYRAIVRELAEPNASVNKICRSYRVTNRTVMGIREREAKSITERKNQLVSILTDVATVGAERMEETIGKAGLRDASIGTGIAVDKMLALTGQMPASVNIANFVLPTPEERARTDAAHRALDEISKLLRKEQPLTAQEKLLLKVELAKLKLTDPQEGPGELPPALPAQG